MNLPLLPLPQKVVVTGGVFALSAATPIVCDEAALPEAQALSALLRPLVGAALAVHTDPQAPAITLTLCPEKEDALGPEGYTLSVTAQGVSAQAAGRAGLFYAAQTLAQLAGGSAGRLPCAEIEDRPRFAWRGAMLDVSRHFLPKEFVLKFIDLLARHKMNVLQLHLTDDQGWRLEIRKYPKLTEIGGTRRETLIGRALMNPSDPGFDPASQRFDGVPHGGWYTQDDAREMVAYAAARHVTLVPEIEMPGHAQAAAAAYPFLGCTDAPQEVSGTWGIHAALFKPAEPTFEFLQDVLTEVMDIFPSPYIHVGGDEAVKTQWRESAECQTIRRELGLPDEAALQAYFVRRMDKFLAESGRTLVGWDEILEGGALEGGAREGGALEGGLSPDAVVMSWRGEGGGVAAAAQHHRVVMAPEHFTYLNFYQADARREEPLAFHALLTLPTVYNYDPVPAALPPGDERFVLGTQCQLWTEYMPDSRAVEYMAFPRLSAFAEAAWTEKTRKDFADFKERLPAHLARLDALDVQYRPHP